ARAATGGTRARGHIQGHVRPSVDALGPYPTRKQKSCGGLSRLCRRAFRPLQGTDGGPVFRRACCGGSQRIAQRVKLCALPASTLMMLPVDLADMSEARK